MTFLIDKNFAKFSWAVFWIPKFNSCLKFFNKTTFFAASGNAALKLLVQPKKQFKCHIKQCGHFWTWFRFLSHMDFQLLEKYVS